MDKRGKTLLEFEKKESLNLKTSRGYIFRILQHFGTKLGISTNLRILFLVVVEYSVLFA